MKSGAEDDLFSDSTASDTDQDDPVESDTETDSDTTTIDVSSTTQSSQRPYIIRREMQNGDIKFERPNRVAMFVHDDVADGEQQLLGQLQQDLNPDPKKLDIREAVYRAALNNQDAIVRELVKMGYDVTE